MKYLVLTLFTAMIATSCANDRGEEDIVEQQREELGIENGGFYEEKGLYTDPDGVYEDPALLD